MDVLLNTGVTLIQIYNVINAALHVQTVITPNKKGVLVEICTPDLTLK